MKNIENPGKLHMKGIIHELSNGAYAIPDFQREFDWSPRDVNELMRSIFEDFYIGTLLLWRSTPDNLKFLHCESVYGFERPSNFQHIVLDGQQRLSAIHYALFAPDKPFPRRRARYFFYIDLERFEEGEFDRAFVYEYGRAGKTFFDDPQQHYARRWFPLGILGDQNTFRLPNWIKGYQEYLQMNGDEHSESKAEFVQKLVGEVLDYYYVSIIELERDIPVEKICDIFTRINNTGVRLDIFDLLNALLRPQGVNLKDRWRKEASRFSPYLVKTEVGRPFPLQTMSLNAQGVCAAKYLYYLVPGAKKLIREKDGQFQTKVIIQDKPDFDTRWESAVKYNLAALQRCSNAADLGSVVPKILPYPTLVPIFAALLEDTDTMKYSDQQGVQAKLRYWYWASIFTTNYSSSVDSQMAQDLREMRIWFQDDRKVPLVVKRFRRAIETPDLLENATPNSAVYKGVFSLLGHKGALDFNSWNRPEYSRLDDHHIVPHAWGKRFAPDLADSLLNRTLIHDDTNRNLIRARLPNDYMKEMLEKAGDKVDAVYELLASHLISKEALGVLLRDPFTRVDFEEFLKLREQAIYQEVTHLLDGLVPDAESVDIDLEVEDVDEEYLLSPEVELVCSSGLVSAIAHPGRGNRVQVSAGSNAAATIAPSFETHNYNRERQYLLDSGILEKRGDVLEFTTDYEFSSPSAGAAVVLGRAADGPKEWKVKSTGEDLYTRRASTFDTDQ